VIRVGREGRSALLYPRPSVPEQVGKALDQLGIAVRAGHHRAQPILRRLGVEKTVPPSLALYNTRDDIHAFISALQSIQKRNAYRKGSNTSM
jgi:cysteine desulfurase/selenocysteine lyase